MRASPTFSEREAGASSAEKGVAGLRRRSASGGPGTYGVGGGGGASGTGELKDDRVACKSCGKLLFSPKGFDLALIPCPHCLEPMG